MGEIRSADRGERAMNHVVGGEAVDATLFDAGRYDRIPISSVAEASIARRMSTTSENDLFEPSHRLRGGERWTST